MFLQDIRLDQPWSVDNACYFLASMSREGLENLRSRRKNCNFNSSNNCWVTTHVLGSRNFSPAFLPAGAIGGRPGEWLAPLISIILKTNFMALWESSNSVGRGELLARLEAGWGRGQALFLTQEGRHCFDKSCKKQEHNHFREKDYPGSAHEAISVAFNQLQAAWVTICKGRDPKEPPAQLDELLEVLHAGVWKPSLIKQPGGGAGDVVVEDPAQPGVAELPLPVPAPQVLLAVVDESDVQSAEDIVRLEGSPLTMDASPPAVRVRISDSESSAEARSDAGGSGRQARVRGRRETDGEASTEGSAKRKASTTRPKRQKTVKSSRRDSGSSSVSSSGPRNKKPRSKGGEEKV